MTSPKDGAEIEGDSVEVTVSATDQGGGIDEIRLYHNGKAVGGDNSGIKVVSKGAGRTPRRSRISSPQRRPGYLVSARELRIEAAGVARTLAPGSR
ncbi:MAG: Ig-like domain-containing protein [Elusimicrobia bacterium]|nr:Ig-like domain-containing protein [Elusimicrobiota bacterium]